MLVACLTYYVRVSPRVRSGLRGWRVEVRRLLLLLRLLLVLALLLKHDRKHSVSASVRVCFRSSPLLSLSLLGSLFARSKIGQFSSQSSIQAFAPTVYVEGLLLEVQKKLSGLGNLS